MSIISELKRRNVLRVATAYVVTAWLVIQVVETILPAFGFGDAVVRMVTIALGIGLVPTVIVAWVFELTPEGLKRDSEVDRSQSIAPQTGKKLDRMIMAVLALALAYFAFDKFALDPHRDSAKMESAAREGAQRALEEQRLGMIRDKSIAVLPFVNRSDLREDEYFSDGMHDELLTRLSRVSALKVISRTSVMRYRDSMLSIPEIARQLSVATVLEGGLQRVGDHVRINVQLIDARTDEHLWAEIYDREMTAKNLFAIQSEISTAIADALSAELSVTEKALLADLPTDNLDAYDHYLRGRQLYAQRTTASLQQALEEYQQAVAIDSNFALAWVGVADASYLLNERSEVDRESHASAHKAAIDKALALDDRLGEAYASLGFYYADMDELEKAEAALLKSIELNPNYSQGYHWLANFNPRGLNTMEAREQRLAYLYKAAELDPMSAIVRLNIAQALDWIGRTEESYKQYHRLLELDPDFSITYALIGVTLESRGKLALAYQWYRKNLELNPAGNWPGLASVHIALGNYETAGSLRLEAAAALGASHPGAGWIDYNLGVAQSQWGRVLEEGAQLPEAMRNRASVQEMISDVYLFAGDFDKAKEHLLNVAPYLTDRAQWDNHIRESGHVACRWAGILIEAGEAELGNDLLSLYQDMLDSLPDFSTFDVAELLKSKAVCALVSGDAQTALEAYGAAVDQGLLINDWFFWSKLPWWKPLQGNPRYLALVARIEEHLAEQKRLLIEMDQSEEVQLKFE
jgi:TolB-like protein/Flp pilus assembly protein TadD